MTKRKQKISCQQRIIFDILMTLLFMALMKVGFTGIAFHELLGLGIFVLFAVHVLLNNKWLKAVCKNIFYGRPTKKAALMLALDFLLLIFVCCGIVSGILISQTILTGITAADNVFWSDLHHFAAYVSLLLISIHIGLHWKMVMNEFKKMLGLSQENGMRTWLARAVTLVIAIWGALALANPSIRNNYAAPFVADMRSETGYAYMSKKKSASDSAAVTWLSAKTTTDDTPTLEEYLSKLFCSACPKRCPLTNLQCQKGNRVKKEAVTQYNSAYGQNDGPSSDTVIENDSPHTEANLPNIEDSLNTEADSPNTEADSGASNNSNSRTDNGYDENNADSLIVIGEENGTTPLDYASIMGLVIAGTHYTITVPQKFKHRRKNSDQEQ